MTILCIDDEPFALELLKEAIHDAAPEADLRSFAEPELILEYAKTNACDVAFLDIEMRGMSGLTLAKRLKEHSPKVNIIFVTGYSQYAQDALHLRVSGYVTKPITREKIAEELRNLRNPVTPKKTQQLRVQCFGNFEVYKDDLPLSFSRTRAKEVLAYLIFKRGGACSWQDIAAILYEDEPFGLQQGNRVRQLIVSMTQSLREAGAEDVLVKHRNSISVNPAMVDCDYYRFLSMDVSAINAYTGEFMAQYEWAVFVVGFLDHQKLTLY
ncbi:MAG: response regulator [Eubacteriales bacterium]|nr:response regulator [Eubacteriales bacterium]